MIKKQLLPLSLAISTFGALFANEYRAPLVSERGPLRYDLNMKKEKWSFSSWTAMHSRNANRSFLEHGIDAKTLPATIFGKEEFTIAESFEQNDAVLKTAMFENSNPFYYITNFYPEASYTDKGQTIGGRLEIPVWSGKGRVGVRVSVPFKTIRIERDDDNNCEVQALNEYVSYGDDVRVVDANGTAKVFRDIARYKLNLLHNIRILMENGAVRPAVLLNDGSTNPASGFYQTQYTSASGTGESITHGSVSPQGYEGDKIPLVIVRGSGTDGKKRPLGVPAAVTVDDSGYFRTADNNSRVVFGVNNLVAPANNSTTPSASDLFALKNDLSNVTAANKNRAFVFANGVDYTDLPNQAGFDTLWVAPVYNGDSSLKTSQADSILTYIENDLRRFSQSAECLLSDLGYTFATYERTGMGDVDADVFYEHTFSEDLRTEFSLGARFPTGGSSKFCGNPYRMQLGNGNHFEVKLGALVGWQTPFDWLTLKSDLSYAWVLQATEQRAAAFEGATIQNIGPCAKADVDWGYLTGHLDFMLYHPKNRRLSTTVGYEFYYKTADNVRFKDATLTTHFLGKVWGNEDGTVANATTTGDRYVDYAMKLSNKAAEKNTERISHRIRTEMHWHADKYWSLFAGGAYTFAGQNVFCETDVHAGISIRY